MGNKISTFFLLLQTGSLFHPQSRTISKKREILNCATLSILAIKHSSVPLANFQSYLHRLILLVPENPVTKLSVIFIRSDPGLFMEAMQANEITRKMQLKNDKPLLKFLVCQGINLVF